MDAWLCAAEEPASNLITAKDVRHADPDFTRKKKAKPLVAVKGGASDSESSKYESDSDEPEDDKETMVIATPPVSGGVGEDEPVPPGLRLLTTYDGHFDSKFYELEKVPTSVANIQEKPPPLQW